MAACYLITRDVLIRYHRRERIRLTQKIVFELSLANFWASFFSAFMSTWMVPKDSGDYQAAGNTASCTAQGFLDSLFYGLSVFMNAILALTYCIIVKCKKKDEIKSRWKTLSVLALPAITCLLLAIMPLFDQAYNFTDFHACGIAEYPLGCLSENYDYDCSRGRGAKGIKIARFVIISVASLVIIGSICVLVMHAVSTERRRRKSNARARINLLSMKSTRQGILYVAAFLFSWGPWYLWQWVRITSGMKTMAAIDSPALLYFISVTNPLQGVANAIVYFRPQYRTFRERDHNEPRLASVFRALQLTVPKVLYVDYRRVLRQKNDDDGTDKDAGKLEKTELGCALADKDCPNRALPLIVPKVLYTDHRRAAYLNKNGDDMDNGAGNLENGIIGITKLGCVLANNDGPDIWREDGIVTSVLCNVTVISFPPEEVGGGNIEMVLIPP